MDDEDEAEDENEAAEAAEDGDAAIRCGGGGARRPMHETGEAGADWSGIERQCARAPRKPDRLCVVQTRTITHYIFHEYIQHQE